MSELRPMAFRPIVVSKPWGGRKLAAFGKPLPPEGTFGESWEIADLDPGAVTSSRETRSRSVDDGRPLHELVADHGAALLGSARATAAGDFPLLVKFLDAREHLSVQVHPTAEYVADHPATWLKTESWYVLDAEPGAVIFIGFRAGVTMEDLRAAAGRRSLVDLLQPIPAAAGDFHHLPAGIIHALGAGVMVAEPQTPSDTTFRLYDWTEEYGRDPRPLHVEEALETVDLRPKGAISLSPMELEGSRMLVETRHYWAREHRSVVDLDPAPELRILQVVRGDATVTFEGSVIEAPLGSTVLVPAVCTPGAAVMCTGDATVLEIGLV
jgi:mannose-6-phosphate isomerase